MPRRLLKETGLFSAVVCYALSGPVYLGRADDPPRSEQAPNIKRVDNAMTKVVESLSTEKAFHKGEFKYVRGVFSKFFEDAYADEIKAGFGSDYAAITAWLEQNPEIKEMLYTAIDPESDRVMRALAVFKDLYKQGPEKLKTYANVAVACAVVWDDPRAAYDYRGHQIRTQSKLPDGVMNNRHIENYNYLIENEASFKNNLQHLPWEMLVHVVNHFTPASERTWALSQYTKRKMIGTTYKDVQYDTEMLRTELRSGPGKGVCKIGGKDYTLENLKKFGGVCAQQADYSSRVAKSMCIPAEYVGGEGNSGGRHAWVMWVEIKSITKEKLDVSLQSEGRYLLDQFYVGTLHDPKTGKEMTDREMEMQLAAVVYAPNSARQADLLMRAYPVVAEKKSFTTKQKLDYVRNVIELFTFSDRAWSERASLIKSGGPVDATSAVNISDTSIRVFNNYPDFSWKYADDLLTPVKDKRTRARQFEKLVTRYEQLGRPDLACEARLKLADYQLEAKDYKTAAEGLSKTIAKFPSEGRYVPKMLGKLQVVCGEYKGGTEKLAQFYLQLLPLIPTTRGNEVSDFCIKVHEQALEFFKKNGKSQDIRQIEARLATLKRNSPKGS
ncbi:MAG: hypothetical protein U0798_10430 [Gemmataceae bacterium]